MLAERVIEDGFSFLLVIAVLAFLWFRGPQRKRPSRRETIHSEPVGKQNKAA